MTTPQSDPYGYASLQPPGTKAPPADSRKTSRTVFILLGLLLLFLLTTIASATVIVYSHLKPESSFIVKPTVILAALSSVSNLSLQIILPSVITVIRWRAAHDGATLARLHYICNWKDLHNWKAVLVALRSGKDVILVIAATIAVIVASFAVDPLLQHATSIENHNSSTPITLNFALPPRIPREDTTASTGNLNIEFLDNTREWYRKDPIPAPYSGCKGRCVGSLIGAGIETNCTVTTKWIDRYALESNGTVLFSYNQTSMVNDDGIAITRLVAIYVSDTKRSCFSEMTTETCDLIPRNQIYELDFTKSAVSFTKTVSSGPVYGYEDDLDPQSIGFMRASLGIGRYWKGSVMQVLDGNSTHFWITARPSGWLQELFVNSTTTEPMPTGVPKPFVDAVYGNRTAAFGCWTKFNSPMSTFVDGYKEIAFRAAVRAGTRNAKNVTSDLPAVQTIDHLVVVSHLGPLIGALVINTLTLFILTFLVWGSWGVSSDVGLGPLHVALAFKSPLLRSPTDTMDVTTLVSEVGQRKVQYVKGSLGNIDRNSKGV